MTKLRSERLEIEKFFAKLRKQPMRQFPKTHQRLDAPRKHGVYVIRKKTVILHVGRTLRGKDGLYQRLKNHMHGLSSFARKYLKGDGGILRKPQYTYQYHIVEDKRIRALLEAYAIGKLCPRHIGLGE
jgi:hypothetical protein